MERIKKLNLYQKCILAILLLMFVAFTIAYPVVTSRVGFAYKGAILIPREGQESTEYTGRVRGDKIMITVTKDKTVTVCGEEKTYGPYTAKEDPSAIPEYLETALTVVGVELLQGNEVYFRGGVLRTGGSNSELVLYDESGSLNGITISYTGSDGIERDGNGNPIDPLKPSPAEILELMDGPQLTNKGDWQMWMMGVFISALTAVMILFADELFRWNLRYLISDPDRAEPSEWEITSRYIGWTILPVVALIAYIVGLTI